MSTPDDKLSRVRAAMRAYWIYHLEARVKDRAKFDDARTEVENARDVLSTMTPDQLDQFRQELRDDLLRAVPEGSRVGCRGGDKFFVDRLLEALLTESLPQLADRAPSPASSAEASNSRPRVPGETEECYRCGKPAVIHITEIEEKNSGDLHLCQDHAREYLKGGASEEAS